MLHPSVRLVIWLGGVVTLQFVEGLPLAAAAALILLACLALSARSALRLLRRSRWLLLSIALFFFFGTSGVLLVPDLGWASPTREGGVAAAEHLARLAAVIGLVGWLIGRGEPLRLLEGLHQLMAPVAALGLPCDRVSVRLLLVLHYAANGTREQWREWLAGRDGGVSAPSGFALERHALGWADLAALGMLAVAAAVALVLARA